MTTPAFPVRPGGLIMDRTHCLVPGRIDHVLGVRRVKNLLFLGKLVEDVSKEIALRFAVEASARLIEKNDNPLGLVLVRTESGQE
jgi:hypothetical protein